MAKSTNSATPKEIVVETQHSVKMIRVKTPGGIHLALQFDSDGYLEDISNDTGMPSGISDEFYTEILDQSEEDFRDFVLCLGAARVEYAKVHSLGRT